MFYKSECEIYDTEYYQRFLKPKSKKIWNQNGETVGIAKIKQNCVYCTFSYNCRTIRNICTARNFVYKHLQTSLTHRLKVVLLGANALIMTTTNNINPNYPVN